MQYRWMMCVIFSLKSRSVVMSTLMGFFYDLVTMFNLHLEKLGHQKKFLLSEKFTEVCNMFDNLMAERHPTGLGVPKQTDFVTPDMEEDLWNKGILGETDPDNLCQTVFYFIGSRFGLHGGKEHHSFVRFPQSQITIQQKPDSSYYLVYCEFVSKTNQGSIHSCSKKGKISCTFCSGFRPRCFEAIYKEYLYKCPEPTRFWNAFYLKTDPQ